MTGWDWLILAVLLISVIAATARGFFLEIFALAGVIVGYLVAAWQYPRAAAWFVPYVNTPRVAEVAGFLTIFLIVVLLAGLAGKMARWIGKGAGFRWADRALGAAFGFVRGGLLVTVCVTAVASFAPESRALAESQVAPYFLVVGRALVRVAPQELRQRLRDGINEMRARKRQGSERTELPSEKVSSGPERHAT
jgi:membrane protein required for colicin V production